MNRATTLRASLTSSLLVIAACLAACKYPYPGDVEDAANACTPATTTCTGDTLTVCDATGQPTSTTTCAFGCFTSGDRCADLAPSNGLAMYLDQARNSMPLHLTEPASLDTDTGQLMTTVNVPVTTAVITAEPVDILVVMASSVDVGEVYVVGHRALAIVSDGDVRIGGKLNVSTHAGLGGTEISEPGPGGRSVDDLACAASRGMFSATGYAGAGGGGHGARGGRGGRGDAALGGAGGEVVGNDALVPLAGGCPGAQAWGPQGDAAGPHAGAGGGAIQIATRAGIVLEATGAVLANGAGAAALVRACPFMAGDPPGCKAGSGGGAGGGILLEAATLVIPATAGLTANGGGGNCDAIGGGASGEFSEAPAAGQQCTGASGQGVGGRGGAIALAAGDGGDGTITGGGGGGGVGRIRLNLPVGVTFDPGPPIIGSPLRLVGGSRPKRDRLEVYA